MLTIEQHSVCRWPTLKGAADVAARLINDDPEWSYLCESHDDGKTWQIAIFDEYNIKIGYIG